MGQCWAFANLQTRQTTGCSYKFGEWFFDCHTWIASLVIPPTPATPVYDDNNSFLGSWAGNPIICLGDYADDFPEGLFNEYHPDAFMNSCTQIEAITMDSSSKQVWALRNLSKREYVRSNGIPTCRDEILVYQQDIGLNGYPGLPQVLFSRLGWSSDSSCSMSYKGPLQLHRGPWAGDIFDVRVFDDVIESMKDEGGWVDITRIAARDIYDLYKSENYYEEDFEEEPQESDEE